MRLMTFLICTVFSCHLIGQTAFSAVMQQTEKELIYLYEKPLEEVLKQNEQHASEGFELIDLEYKASLFWAVWKQTGETTTTGQANSWEAFQELKKQKIKDGQLLSKLLIYKDEEGQQQFVGLWKNKRLAHNIWKMEDLKSVEFHYKEMAKLSLYLQDVQVVAKVEGGFSYYLIYHKGSPEEMTHFTQFPNESAFNEDYTKRIKSHYRPVDIEVVTQYGIPHYFCLYRKEEAPAQLGYQLGWESLVHFQDHLGESFKLVDIEFSTGKQRIFAPDVNQERVKKTPDIDLAAIQISTKGTDASLQNHSAALAAANGLYWLAEQGFDKLKAGSATQAEQATAQIARKLADGNHMKTLLPSKANKYSVIEGLSKYIDKDYEIKDIQFYDIHHFDPQQLSEKVQSLIAVEDSLTEIPLQKAREGLIGSTIVLVQWGRYQPSGDGKHLIKESDQWGTLVGYGQNEHEVEKADYLTVHDPYDGTKARQKYFRVADLEPYFLTREATMLKTPSPDWKDESESYIEIPALKRQVLAEFEQGAKEVKVFPIWESLLIINIE
jgi:hypothetical protein